MVKWYRSKTVWTNIIAIGALIAQSSFGFAVTPEESIALLGTVNLIVRAYTKEPLEL